MRTSDTEPQLTPALAPDEIERDRRMEVLMDEILKDAEPPTSLPADFTARVLAKRPFAPWETRHLHVWKVPAAVAGGLLSAGVGISLTPIFTLGPGTALTMWTELLVVSLGRPALSFLAAGPRLVEGLALVFQTVPGTPVLLGATAALSGAALLLTLRGLRRARTAARSSLAAPRPGG